MVSDYKITMEQAEYEMVCYRRVFNFVRLLDQDKLEKLNAEGLLAAEGGQTKKADLCIGHFCQGCVAMEAFLRKAELCKLEFIGDDIYQIMAKYLEIDGNPYVMELLKKMIQDICGLLPNVTKGIVKIIMRNPEELTNTILV